MDEKKIKCLIVGCGRSGTGFAANILKDAGHDCSHEKVFHPETNPKSISLFSYESSWMSAPFIDCISDLTHIIHIVRDPNMVINSFLKVGLFSPTPLRQVTKGKPVNFLKKIVLDPKYALDRWNYVQMMRRFVRQHTSSFEEKIESKRIEVYWREWNSLIEEKSRLSNAKYKTITLDSMIENPHVVTQFLELSKEFTATNNKKMRIFNKKEGYRSRKMQISLDNETKEQAKRYGL